MHPALYGRSPVVSEKSNFYRTQHPFLNLRLLKQRVGLTRRTTALAFSLLIFLIVYLSSLDPWPSLSLAPPTPFILTGLGPVPKNATKVSGPPSPLSKAFSSVSRLTAPKYRPRCERPSPLESQYSTISSAQSNFTVFLALDLHNAQSVLPTFIYELPVLLSFMGSHRFHVSIFENGSSDLSPSLLVTLARLLDALGTSYEIVVKGEHVKSHKENNFRIAELVRFRNAALDSLYTGRAARVLGIAKFDVVLFMNDIIWCTNDVLEVMYEHVEQQAHLTCTVDWGSNVVYDRWVARTMSGSPFYAQDSLIEYFNGPNAYSPPIPHPLPYDPHDRERFEALQPFQVFSCWNGAVVIDARAFSPGLTEITTPSQRHDGTLAATEGSQPSSFTTTPGVRFRTADNDVSTITEKASECFLFSVDLWKKGMGKIMIVPRASVAYDLGQYERVRQEGGRTVSHPIGIEHPGRSRITKALSRYPGSANNKGSRSWNADKGIKIQWASTPPQNVAYHDYAWWHEKERWGRWDEA